ncbi:MULTISPECIES: YezD family protein [unclassified Bacillus (in: firmicutes)]|uniref:YezD family protein n=1 Tax=Bacillus TaxID=1386 RepID=UPI00338EC774
MDEQKLNFILSALKSIEYGSVVITIHNGHITQVDTTEKTRFPFHQEKVRVQKTESSRYR